MTQDYKKKPPAGSEPRRPAGSPTPSWAVTRTPPPYQSPYRDPRVVPPPPVPPLKPQGSRQPPRKRSSAASAFLVSVLVFIFIFFLGVSLAVGGYIVIARSLPPPEALSSRSASFVNTQIYDRDGHLLYEIFDPEGGRRILVPYEQISPHLINATVATEDSRFWQHPGVDLIGIIRAVVQNVKGGGHRLRRQHHPSAAGQAGAAVVGGAHPADADAQDPRGGARLGGQPALLKAGDPGDLCQRDQLWPPGLRHRGRGRDLLSARNPAN